MNPVPIWKKQPHNPEPEQTIKALCPSCKVVRTIFCCKYGKWIRCAKCDLDIHPRTLVVRPHHG